jgi:hypothetical protein
VSTAFDQALEQRDLYEEADGYALRHGQPGTAPHRAAWLRFHQRIKTGDDLLRWRLAKAAKARQAAQLSRASGAGSRRPSTGVSNRRADRGA